MKRLTKIVIGFFLLIIGLSMIFLQDILLNETSIEASIIGAALSLIGALLLSNSLIDQRYKGPIIVTNS